MPRQPRKFSISEVYHIIYNGIDGQDIFYDDSDKRVFLKKLLENKNEFMYKIFSYCLMSNHVHLVIEINDENLSKAMKSLSLKYVLYFNKKYERSGPLFQNRFNSKCVENQRYFLDVCKYVHQNPEKARICKTKDYKWSSYHEYIGKEKIINKDAFLQYYNGNIDDFINYTNYVKSENELDFIEYEFRTKMTDNELAEFIVNKLNLRHINEFSNLSGQEFNKGIEILKNIEYTNFSQLARVTRINAYQLKKYWKRGAQMGTFKIWDRPLKKGTDFEKKGPSPI